MSQPGEINGSSKCPIMKIVNGTKGLLRAAAPVLEERPTQHFAYGEFDYTPFSAPNYQVATSSKNTVGKKDMSGPDSPKQVF